MWHIGACNLQLSILQNLWNYRIKNNLKNWIHGQIEF